MNKKQVLLAMSGGIDSAVAAHLLKMRGFAVYGVHFKFWHWEEDTVARESSIIEELQTILDMEIKIVDYQEAFRRVVVDEFIDDLKIGLTPNPCVRCNPEVKFRLLSDIAERKELQYISTGHYVRVSHDEVQNCFLLKKGMDKKKDQSYMLSYLTQPILAKSLFPLGNLNKMDVYKIGKQLNLPITAEKESQDLCFIKPTNYQKMLSSMISIENPGEVIDSEGRVLGHHKGLFYFTIGQRKGIEIPASRAYYVIRKDRIKNQLVVGYKDELETFSFKIERPNWISGHVKKSFQAAVKIRYRAKEVRALVEEGPNKEFQVSLNESVRGVTPGQYAVFYDHDIVIGGGRILG